MKEILNYLSSLSDNNNREWYHSHKEEYKEANEEFERLVKSLILEIGKTDSSILHNIPKELILRITRDTRFSKDKSPYNPSFRANIGPNGKQFIPVGYFIQIKHGNKSFLGGGMYSPMFKDATTMIRDYIVKNGDEFEKIINDSKFKKYFYLRGEVLKNVPRGYDKEHPQAEYLKNKSWYIEYDMSDEELLDEKFVLKAAEICEAMQPFNNFLNRALENFVVPKR